VRGRGRVRHRDGDHAVVEAELLDADGALLATATAVARVIGLAAARGAV
jgi:acyl-coenzyme A thioesterase PaaI-like protein